MSKYFVLGARTFDFTNDKGQRFSGIKVTYIDSKEDSETAKGYQPIVINGDASLFAVFAAGSGVYDLDIRMRPDHRFKPVPTLVGAQLVEQVDLGNLASGR